MASVEYAYYHPDFGSGIEHSADIESLAETLNWDEYNDEIHYKKIFCPRCKVGLKRTPRTKNRNARGIEAYFAHHESDIECAWHTQTTKGIRHLNEEDTWKAIDDENLTVVTQWSDVPDEENWVNGRPVYTGPNENPFSDEATEATLGRYSSGEIPLPNRITSVRTIAINIDAYKHKAIMLPDSGQATEVQSLLRPLDSDEFDIDGNSYLYYGRVKSFVYGDPDRGDLNFANIENATQKTSIWIPKQISDTRQFGENTEGRVLLIYGYLARKPMGRYAIRVQQLGQIAYVPKAKERYFWY